MAYEHDTTDAFAGGEKIPSLSWKDLPVGSTFTLEVLDAPKILQSRDFETNEPAWWDPEEKTRPKNSAVTNVRVLDGPHSVGEDRSIWAQIPSNMFIAIKNAKGKAPLAPGGRLQLRFAGTVPHENKRYSPIKQYEARYTPPAPSDVFHDDPAPQPQAARQPVKAASGASSW